jgi:hypothetical protein
MIVPQHNRLAAIDIAHRQSRHPVLNGAREPSRRTSTPDA